MLNINEKLSNHVIKERSYLVKSQSVQTEEVIQTYKDNAGFACVGVFAGVFGH